MKTMQLKLCGCLFILVAASHSAQAQKTFGGKTEGGGPGGSPDTNCPCWRYPIRAIGYRKIDLRPLFAWWRENYGAYQAAVSAATKADQPPDFSSLQPSPAPGWQRIKEAHFIANVAYGWECQGVVEDVPSHSVTNKIIIRNPPTADKAKWDNLVAQYEDLKEEETPMTNGPAQKPKQPRSRRAAYAAAYQQPATTQGQNSYQTNTTSTNAAAHHHPAAESPTDRILDELKKFPEGTNYTVDLFALKIGYLQDGSHRQVFDLGQIYAK